MKFTRRALIIGTGAVATDLIVRARTGTAATYEDPSTYSSDEILEAGHHFFGSITKGVAHAIEYVFHNQGEPVGYIVGEEGSGAFIAGLRYGEGQLHTKFAGQSRIFWQGPSLGWDMGADGARTMMLVYNIASLNDLYRRLPGVNGSAYMVAGAGVSIYGSSRALVAPIRSGVGARLGVNMGYLRFTERPTWNPF